MKLIVCILPFLLIGSSLLQDQKLGSTCSTTSGSNMKMNLYLQSLQIKLNEKPVIEKADANPKICAGQFDKHGSCCDSQSLAEYSKKEDAKSIEYFRKYLARVGIFKLKILPRILKFANSINFEKIDAQIKKLKADSSALKEFQNIEKILPNSTTQLKFVMEVVTNFKGFEEMINSNGKKCFDILRQSRSNAMCALCSGNSANYFDKDFNLKITPQACYDVATGCGRFWEGNYKLTSLMMILNLFNRDLRGSSFSNPFKPEFLPNPETIYEIKRAFHNCQYNRNYACSGFLNVTGDQVRENLCHNVLSLHTPNGLTEGHSSAIPYNYAPKGRIEELQTKYFPLGPARLLQGENQVPNKLFPKVYAQGGYLLFFSLEKYNSGLIKPVSSFVTSNSFLAADSIVKSGDSCSLTAGKNMGALKYLKKLGVEINQTPKTIPLDKTSICAGRFNEFDTCCDLGSLQQQFQKEEKKFKDIWIVKMKMLSKFTALRPAIQKLFQKLTFKKYMHFKGLLAINDKFKISHAVTPSSEKNYNQLIKRLEKYGDWEKSFKSESKGCYEAFSKLRANGYCALCSTTSSSYLEAAGINKFKIKVSEPSINALMNKCNKLFNGALVVTSVMQMLVMIEQSSKMNEATTNFNPKYLIDIAPFASVGEALSCDNFKFCQGVSENAHYKTFIENMFYLSKPNFYLDGDQSTIDSRWNENSINDLSKFLTNSPSQIVKVSARRLQTTTGAPSQVSFKSFSNPNLAIAADEGNPLTSDNFDPSTYYTEPSSGSSSTDHSNLLRPLTGIYTLILTIYLFGGF